MVSAYLVRVLLNGEACSVFCGIFIRYVVNKISNNCWKFSTLQNAASFEFLDVFNDLGCGVLPFRAAKINTPFVVLSAVIIEVRLQRQPKVV